MSAKRIVPSPPIEGSRSAEAFREAVAFVSRSLTRENGRRPPRAVASPQGAEAAVDKAQIVEDIAEAVEGLTKRQAAAAFDAVVDSVRKHLQSDGTVKVAGLGSFSIAERPSREVRRPLKQKGRFPTKKLAGAR